MAEGDLERPKAAASARGSQALRGNAQTSADGWVLAGLLVFTLIVRGAVLWAMHGNLEQDPDAYREIAENLIVHGEFALGKLTPQTDDWQPRPTAYRPPLYPVVLSNLPAADRQHVSLVKVGVLHLVLGVATVWLTWATARRMSFLQASVEMADPAHPTQASAGPPGLRTKASRDSLTPASRPGLFPNGPPGLIWPPLVAGFIVACDPILLNQQALVMTETLAAFLAILSLWCLARFDAARTPFNAAMAGGAIGLAVLCRPTFLPWLGLVAGGMLFMRGGPTRKSQISKFRFENLPWRMANVAGLLFVAAVVVSPWAIRNYRVFGKPIVTTTHGGYTFLLGNNTSFYDWLSAGDSGTPWSAADMDLFEGDLWRMLEGADPDLLYVLYGPYAEIRLDDGFYASATNVIRRNPLLFISACGYRVIQLWSPLPHRLAADESMMRRCLRYATCGWYCGVYALAVMGIWRLFAAHGTPWRAFPTALAVAIARLRQPPWVWGVLLCVAFTAVHTFYWANLRMRAPLMPFVAILAAGAASSRFKVQGSKLADDGP